MNIAVTGSTGFVGSNLVRHLVAAGHRVRAVVHGDDAVLDGLDVERVPGDVRDPASLRVAFRGQEVVMHLAAFISVIASDADQMHAVNVVGVGNSARAALEEGVGRFVHVSSVHAFDTWRLGDALSEDHPKAERAGLPSYDRSKAAGEAALQAVVVEGLDAVILNPVGVLGPGDHGPSLAGGALMEMVRGRVPVLPDGGFCWVDVRDVVAAAAQAITRGGTGENHLLSAGRLSSKELHRLGAAAVGGRSWAIRAPIRLLRPVSRASPLLAPLYPQMHGFTPDSLHALDARLMVDVRKSREVLGFNPRPLAHTVRDAVAWWREAGALA